MMNVENAPNEPDYRRLLGFLHQRLRWIGVTAVLGLGLGCYWAARYEGGVEGKVPVQIPFMYWSYNRIYPFSDVDLYLLQFERTHPGVHLYRVNNSQEFLEVAVRGESRDSVVGKMESAVSDLRKTFEPMESQIKAHEALVRKVDEAIELARAMVSGAGSHSPDLKMKLLDLEIQKLGLQAGFTVIRPEIGTAPIEIQQRPEAYERAKRLLIPVLVAVLLSCSLILLIDLEASPRRDSLRARTGV